MAILRPCVLNVWWVVWSAFMLAGCSETPSQTEVQTDHFDTSVAVYGPYRVIKLPVAAGTTVLNPIQLSLGPNNKLFAANQTGEIYILEDSDGDGLEDNARLFCNVTDFNLRSPSGFASRGDTIYIGTREEIRILLDRDKDGKADTSWSFFDKVPHSEHPYEWTSAFEFGRDGWLYCTLSTDSWNAGPSPDPDRLRGAVLRISPDGKVAEKVATGIRSVNSMRFNQYGDLFFIDNEGGGNPNEELNHLVRGAFYGHNPTKYPEHKSLEGPVHKFETEVAPASIVFNDLKNDFGGTAGDLFVAFYGPGERWSRGGVARIKMERKPNGKYVYKEFAVADIPKLSAMAFGSNGALYLATHGISDYWYNPTEKKSGGFYKLIFDASLSNKPIRKRELNPSNLSGRAVETGKQLYAERACLACHSVDGRELLGPSLQGVGKRLSREEILDEILHPSNIIKPSMTATQITKRDGQVLLGRVVNSDNDSIHLMLIGNKIVPIARRDILRSEDVLKSLMYENLLNGLKDEEINSLLDYVVSLQ